MPDYKAAYFYLVEMSVERIDSLLSSIAKLERDLALLRESIKSKVSIEANHELRHRKGGV